MRTVATSRAQRVKSLGLFLWSSCSCAILWLALGFTPGWKIVKNTRCHCRCLPVAQLSFVGFFQDFWTVWTVILQMLWQKRNHHFDSCSPLLLLTLYFYCSCHCVSIWVSGINEVFWFRFFASFFISRRYAAVKTWSQCYKTLMFAPLSQQIGSK